MSKISSFYVISDDVPFCKSIETLKKYNCQFYVNDNELETLYFMAKCRKGGICANSTFSWWGSYLNTNSKKLVTFPNQWFNNDWNIDIYPKGSIIIPTHRLLSMYYPF